MDEFTVEGAVATGEYVLALYPYVYATGDLSDWQAMSDSECGFCNNVITKVTKLHDAGGWVDPSPHEVVADRLDAAHRGQPIGGGIRSRRSSNRAERAEIPYRLFRRQRAGAQL